MKHLFFVFFAILVSWTHAQVSDFKDIDFAKADNTAKLYEGYSLDNLPVLVHKLTYKLHTDVEKFRAIYYWVCHNIKNDIRQGNRVIRKRTKLDSLEYLKWNSTYKKNVFKTLLRRKKTMCTGYAYLIKELCFLANIECKIIDGYGRSSQSNAESLDMPNHSWNAVKLNNKWYLCDATWSSGYSLNNIFVADYNDGYFLTDPVLFAQNHYPLHKKWLLNENLINAKFIASPLVYGETFEYNVLPISPNKMAITTKKNTPIEFKVKSDKLISEDQISMVQFVGTKEITFKISNIKTENGLTSFTCQYPYKGYYDAHLKINEDIVATYIVRVSK
ncbi:transglutaminase domain-containing protein [Mangrovimonas spongiae]|uniref:Transglutaminase-like domain-containing protein n=1 Tax=Mangrovimonas spongiae TaxID=2494697 RepID=A0A428K2G8_9FLAO|nr:transglutaminase domain-containing protein [Mangrovimonas spongiae]RSK40575.1 hypothetical protein EJA19_06240 [Mangrovimonas spongiae]